MTVRRVQYAIARSVYGQIRYAQAKPGGVPADIIGLGRHLSELKHKAELACLERPLLPVPRRKAAA